MKKFTLCIFVFSLLIMSNSLLAQTGLNFGVKAGYNFATQYGISDPNITYDVNSEHRNGFTGGIFLYFPITESFGVQQEFIYSAKGSTQEITMTVPPVSTSTDYTINYFELPILFKYTFLHLGDFGIYGSSGFALSVLIDGEYSVEGKVQTPIGEIPFSESGETDGLDQFDYSFIYGLGLSFNLFKQKCFFDYRQTIGWNSLMMPTAEGEAPAPLRNQTYSLAFGVYF